MKLLFTTLLLLNTIILSAQYNYGLEVEQQDAKIEGKLELTDGFNSVYIGRNAGINTNGSILNRNTIIGYNSGSNLVGGALNLFVGFEAGKIATGGSNTIVGALAGINLVNGISNVLIGSQSGQGMIAGNGNVAIGWHAGVSSESGSDNVFIGQFAGPATDVIAAESTGSNNVFIGSRAGNIFSTDANNKLVIESTRNPESQLLYGEFDNRTIGINWDIAIPLPATLSVNGTLHISETAKLEPQATPPTGCNTQAMGTMYADTGGNLYFCNGTSWKTVQLN